MSIIWLGVARGKRERERTHCLLRSIDVFDWLWLICLDAMK